MLNCRACRTEIEVAGHMEDLSARAEAHLATCAACRAFQTQQTSLRGLLGALEPVGAPADFDFRLRARMAAQQRTAPRFVFPRFAPRTFAIAVAACLVLAFAVILRRHAPPQPGINSESMTAQGNAVVAPTSVNSPQPIATATTSVAAVVRDKEMTIVEGAQHTTHAQRRVPPVERIMPAGLAARKPTGGAVDVNELGVRAAAVVTDTTLNPATLQAIPVSVAASSKPLKVFFKDTQGTERMISIEPVSFGSRDLPGARGPVVARVNAAAAQGVW